MMSDSSHSVIAHVLQMNQKSKVSQEDIQDLESFRVDFTLVEKMVNKLTKCFANEEELNKALSSLVELIGHQFKTSDQSLFETSLMVWRAGLILLSFDQMKEWEWNQLQIQVLKHMKKAHDLLRERKDTQKMTEFVKITCDKKTIQSIVQKVENSITISIVSGTFSGKDIETAVRVLDVFNDANNLKIVKERVDYREFYNDAINKEVNLNQHYETWIVERERYRVQNRPFDRLHAFTLCSFPWILDSANKAELLKI